MVISSAAGSRHSLLPLFAATRLSKSSAASTATNLISTSPSLSPSAAKSLLLKQFDPDKSISIISSLRNPSSSPASARFALNLAVRRLSSARRFSDIQSLLQSRKSLPFSSQEPFIATLILAYGSARMLPQALSTFHEIPRLCSAPPTAISFNALLSAAVRAKKHRHVRKLFSILSEKHSILPDEISYSVLVKALCLSGKDGEVFEVMKEMQEKGVKPTSFVYTSVIDFLYKKGEKEKAEEMWNEMRERGCELDLVAYNVRIMERAMRGSVEEVVEIMKELEADGLKPDEITYNYLMTCYARAGRFEDMNEVYKGMMRRKGCEPNAATFKIMMGFLCEKGDFEAGFGVFKDSVKGNRIPDFRTLRPFVVGLVKKMKVEEAKKVISVVRQRFPESLVRGWKVVEEELGLDADGQICNQVEAAQS